MPGYMYYIRSACLWQEECRLVPLEPNGAALKAMVLMLQSAEQTCKHKGLQPSTREIAAQLRYSCPFKNVGVFL